MKKYVKPTLVTLVLIAGLLWISGAHVPYIANHARNQLKEGLLVNQVTEIVTSYNTKPNFCIWRLTGTKAPIFSRKRECNFPDEVRENGNEFQLTVVFMGPIYLHNDFDVHFSGGGKVISVSETRHWG
ncbi:MAG: hypothetical protein ACE5K1_03630 [Acidiferrobacterales bacterium]